MGIFCTAEISPRPSPHGFHPEQLYFFLIQKPNLFLYYYTRTTFLSLTAPLLSD